MQILLLLLSLVHAQDTLIPGTLGLGVPLPLPTVPIPPAGGANAPNSPSGTANAPQTDSTTKQSGNGNLQVTQAQVVKALQSIGVTNPNLPLANSTSITNLNTALAFSAITSNDELAMFMAHVFVETGGLSGIKQVAAAQFTGCGFLVLTGKDNYAQASKSIFNDDRLVQNPNLMCTDTAIAWRAATWYWKIAVAPFSGFKDQGAVHFGASTMAINGNQCPGLISPRTKDVIPQGAGDAAAGKRRFQFYTAIRGDFGATGTAADNCGCGSGNYQLGTEVKNAGTVGEFVVSKLTC